MNLYGYADGDPVNKADPFGLSATDCPDGYTRTEMANGDAFCKNVNDDSDIRDDDFHLKEAQAERREHELARTASACTDAAIDAAAAAGTDLAFFGMGAAGAGAKALAAFSWAGGASTGPDALSFVPLYNFARAYGRQLRICKGLTP
jgi:hypothetical protein